MRVDLVCSENLDFWKRILERYPRSFTDVENIRGDISSDKDLTAYSFVILDNIKALKLKVSLENLGRPFVIAYETQEELQKISEYSSCIGVINKKWPEHIIARQLSTSIGEFLKLEIEQELDRMSGDLAEIVSGTLADFQTVKRLHEKFVPLRTETVKGITFSSKYAAGERAGGEFFDVITGDKNTLVVMSSTKSYVASSIVLSHFEQLRNSETITLTEVESFIGGLSSQAQQLGINNSKGEGLQLLVMLINMKTLAVEGFTYGNSRIVSTGNVVLFGNDYPLSPSFTVQASFSFNLKRGDSACILSPGFLRNSSGYKDSPDDIARLKEMLEWDSYKFLNELFFQIKKDTTEEFLEYDASAMHIKVDKNVLVQI